MKYLDISADSLHPLHYVVTITFRGSPVSHQIRGVRQQSKTSKKQGGQSNGK